MSGGIIYVIRCSETSKVYIGSTNSLRLRKAAHFHLLRNGKHHSIHLQRAYNKHGRAAFSLAAVEHVADRLFLQAREQFWLWRHAGHLYNVGVVTHSSAGVKRSPEFAAKQAQRMMGNTLRRGQPMPEGWSAESSARLLGNSNRRGIPHPAADKAKISEGLKQGLCGRAEAALEAGHEGAQAVILVWDVETTGFPLSGRELADPAQPRLVQLAALLLEPDGTERASLNLLVNPGVPIPPGATAVHGIDNALAARAGVAERWAVALWHQLAGKADAFVAHHIAFDWALIGMAWARTSSMPESCEDRHGARRRICTMEAAAPIVNLPPTERMLRAGFNKPKSPKLGECIRHFFGEDLHNAHDALADVRACARVYHHLRTLGAAP